MPGPAVYVNLSVPRRAVEAAEAGVDGVGLLRAEFLVYRTGRHPRLLLRDPSPTDLGTILQDGMRTVARVLHPRPVYYRSLDLRSNEVAQLVGGEAFEFAEDNPALGLRGMTRARRDGDIFAAELAALARVRDEGYDNLHLLLPFVRWPEEVEWAREQLVGAVAGAPLPQVWMMVETPGAVLRAADFAPLVDGVSIGSNDLTQLILGVDRDNVAFSRQNWDSDPAVIDGLRWVMDTFTALKVPVGICGDAPSRSRVLLASLREWGIDNISVSLDRVHALRVLLDESSTGAPAPA
jgi:pyruvate,water dikinase